VAGRAKEGGRGGSIGVYLSCILINEIALQQCWRLTRTPKDPKPPTDLGLVPQEAGHCQPLLLSPTQRLLPVLDLQ
jgi:hypothetical protein